MSSEAGGARINQDGQPFGTPVAEPKGTGSRRTFIKKVSKGTIISAVGAAGVTGAFAETALLAHQNEISTAEATRKLTNSALDFLDPRNEEKDPYKGPDLFISPDMQELAKKLHIRPRSFLHETEELSDDYRGFNDETLLPTFHPAIYEDSLKQMMYDLSDEENVPVNQIALLMTLQTLDGAETKKGGEFGPFAMQDWQFPVGIPEDEYGEFHRNTKAAVMRYKDMLALAKSKNPESTSTSDDEQTSDPNNIIRAILAFKYERRTPDIIRKDYKYTQMTDIEQRTYREAAALLHMMELDFLLREKYKKDPPNNNLPIDQIVVTASESGEIEHRAWALDSTPEYYNGIQDQAREFISRDRIPNVASNPIERSLIEGYHSKTPYTDILNAALRSMNVDGDQSKYAHYESNDFRSINTARPGAITTES